MAEDYDIRSADNFVNPQKGRKSPAEQILDGINERHGGKYYSARMASDILGIHIETVRRVLRDPSKSPSITDVFVKGKLVINLLVEDDLIDLAKYFAAEDRVHDHFTVKYKGRIPSEIKRRFRRESTA